MEKMKSSEIFRMFSTYIMVDIRKSELMSGLLPFILFLYFYYTKQESIYTGIIDLHLSSLPFLIIVFIILRFRQRRGKECKDCSTQKLFELANKLDSNIEKNPFRVFDGKRFLAATFDNHIDFGREYFCKLTSDEKKLFVIGHEFFHFYKEDRVYEIATIFLMICFGLGVAFWTQNPQDAIICLGPCLLLFSRTKRSLESIADFQGKNCSSEEDAVSALDDAYKNRTPIPFETHPKLKIRIKNIRHPLF